MARSLPRFLSFVFGIAVLSSAGVAQNRYSIRHIPPVPGQTGGTAWAIDNLGRVVGRSGTGTGYVFSNGVTQALPDFRGGQSSEAFGFGAGVQLLGTARPTTSNSNHGAIWVPSGSGFTITELAPAPFGQFSLALGMNLAGFVVGQSDSGSNVKPAVWNLGSGGNLPTLLPMPPGATDGSANAITADSTIFGWGGGAALRWKLSGGGGSDGQTWVATTLPSLGFQAQANDVNELGQIGGWAFNSGFHMVAWSASGAIVDLGQFAGSDTLGYSINMSGDIVGQANVPGGSTAVVAFGALGSTPGPIQDLNTMIPPGSPWGHLDSAHGINDSGQIVGQGDLAAFVMTPVALHLTVTPGTAGVTNTWTATGAVSGDTVVFLSAFTGGETLVSGCTVSIDLASPSVLASVVADATGTATFSILVPSGFAGLRLFFQAYEQNACRNSDVRVVTF